MIVQNLNCPHYPHRVISRLSKLWILDPVRKRYVILTPEEWVRQQIIWWLSEEHHYPKSLMQIEQTQEGYRNKKKRTDIVVYDKRGLPFMLVECKSIQVPLSEEVLEQALFYNQLLQAPYLLLTNGLYYSVITFSEKELVFLDKIPQFA